MFEVWKIVEMYLPALFVKIGNNNFQQTVTNVHDYQLSIEQRLVHSGSCDHTSVDFLSFV